MKVDVERAREILDVEVRETSLANCCFPNATNAISSSFSPQVDADHATLKRAYYKLSREWWVVVPWPTFRPLSVALYD
jgi:hypothetical protein